MAYYSKYTGAELEERLDKVEEIPQLIAQMITGKDFVTKEDLLCVLRDYAPATYATIPIDNNTIYWEKGVLKAATSDGTGQCQWELREHNGIQYLYSRLPVVTQYDVTMYADVNHLDLPSIYDGLPIDGDTIYWEETENGRILKSKYEGSSGVDASEVLSIVSNAGYATQNWVNNQSFITQSYLATELLKYVTLDNYQEIIGVKNFINGLQISNIPIKKLEGYDDILYIDSNVVIRGGLTMYYEDGEINLPSIKEEIGNAGYDGVTGLASFDSSQFSISSDGTVTIIGGSAGLDTAQLAEYLTTNKYATQGWITEQNYASASNLTALQSKVDNFLEGSDSDTIINKWLELEAFLSGLSESDHLATILSNKANKSTTLAGYGITDAYTKTQVDNTFKLYIPIAGYTEITGEKNFTGGLRVNNSPVIYYDEDNKYWKLEGDLLVTGGVSMYSDDTDFIPSTIMDAVVVDGVTIKKRSEDGALYFAGTMDGGVTDFWELNNIPTWIGSSKPTYTLGSLQHVDSSSIDATATVDRVLFQQAGSATWITKPLSEIGGGGGGSVSGDYLPLSNTSTPIVLNTQPRVVNFKSSNAYEVGIGLIRGNTDKGSLYASNSNIGIHNKVRDTAFYLKDDGGLKYEINGVEHDVLNAGNYSSYALPLSGGTITGAGNKLITLVSNSNNYVDICYSSKGSTVNWQVGADASDRFYFYNNYLSKDVIQISKEGDIKIIGGSDDGRYTTLAYTGLSFYGSTGGWAMGIETYTNNGTHKGSIVGAYGRSGGFNYWYYGGYYNQHAITILPNYNVGVKTISPSYALHVNGDFCATGGIRDTGAIFYSDTLYVYSRNSDANAYMSFKSNDGSKYYGDIGFRDSTGEASIWTSALSWKAILHEGNYSSYALPLSGGTITGSLTVNGRFSSISAQIGDIFLGEGNEINGTGTRLWINYSGSAQLFLGNNGYPVIVGTYAGQAANIQNTLNYAPFSVFGTIFGYRYGKKEIGAAFMFDKPGSNYTGFGADGSTDTIYFGACNKDADWVSYSQIWKFGGSIITTGGITMYSDIRKKTKLQDVELTLQQIANAPLIQHYYNSDQDKTTHVGSIAQYWANLNDWFCKLDNEGFYTMEIQNCALASAISIARHLEKYESKTDRTIRKMKQRIQELEDKLEKLEGGNYVS